MDASSVNKDTLYDVIIVGGGPAGLTAALYLARAQYRVLVVEKDRFGGKIAITEQVVNYPGIPLTSGSELAENMRSQAEAFGAEFLVAEVQALDLDGAIKTVSTQRGKLYCFGVLLATGTYPKKVGFEGEQKFEGRGIAYCATCDGEFFTGKDVFVIGGGFTAAEESVFLAKFARRVTILIRGNDFSCAKTAADLAKKHDRITVLTNTSVEAVSGETAPTYIRYKNVQTGETTEFHAKEGESFGVFVFAGNAPATALVKDIVELNEQGNVITERSLKTSREGLYAAGDVCVKPLRQITTAVGDGALAATELEKYVSSLQAQTGLLPKRPATEQEVPQTELDLSDAPEKNSASMFFDDDMLAQLHTVFEKMEAPLVLRVYTDKSTSSSELEHYMETLASLTQKLGYEAVEENIEHVPCVKLFRPDGSYTGLAFHGVPGGHEFTSFVVGLYNAAGPGQPLDAETQERIDELSLPLNMKVLVTLTCPMCPELVIAAQKIASVHPDITAEIYDINLFSDLQEKYQVMSVPCLVINDSDVSFGRKNISQLLDLFN